MFPIFFSYKWGNLLVSLVEKYHFPNVGSCLNLATLNKGIAFILVSCMCHPTLGSQGRGSWTSGWMSLSFFFRKSLCSNSGAWYGRTRSTLNIRCSLGHEGMLSWKLFSPIFLRILYGTYRKGFIFLNRPVKNSFLRCN